LHFKLTCKYYIDLILAATFSAVHASLANTVGPKVWYRCIFYFIYFFFSIFRIKIFNCKLYYQHNNM